MLGLSAAIQYGITFGLVLAVIGIFLSKKINLWNEFKVDKKAIITSIIITITVALILFPGDKLIFAAGHLPSTATMTDITPLLVFRCFLFNGGIGLAFGYLYRKYNIRYAIASHGFSHLIADVLMLIFI